MSPELNGEAEVLDPRPGIAVLGENVTFQHGKDDLKAVQGANITVQRGNIYSLLGPSGCGKTTLLRCITGFLQPQSGRVLVFGRKPGEKGFCIPGKGVGYMPQDIALYPEISTDETLTYFTKLYQMDRKEAAKRINFLVSLLEIPDRKALVQNLSGGQKRRVSFAVALIHKPPLLLMDEPTVGVDPLLRQSIWNYLNDLAKETKMTILVTTHYVEEARNAQMVGFMRDGKVMLQMNPEELIKRFEVTTLEQAFLIICRSKTIKDTTSDQDGLPRDGYNWPKAERRSSKSSDVWVHYKDLREEDDFYDGARSSQVDIERQQEELDIIFSKTKSYPIRLKESLLRLTTLTGKNFVRMRRNIPLIFFEILVPVIQVVVFCLCIGGEPYDLKLAVVNEEADNDAFGHKFLNSINNKTFIQVPFDDIGSALRSAESGECWGALHIPRTFTESLMDRYIDGATANNETIDSSEIHLYLDMTNQQISSTAYSVVMRGFEKFSKDLLVEFGYNPRLADPPVVLKKAIYGSLESSFTEFMAPGMIVGITYMMSIALTAMSIIIERKWGLLERSIVAGVTSVEIVGSIMLHLVFTMILQIAIVLLITFMMFDLPVHGSMAWVIFCVFLVGLSGMSYGLFVSSICGDENSAMMVSMGSFYPNLLLSGVIWPVEAMPVYLRYLSYGLPMTLITQTVRSILSKGWGMTENQIWNGPLICFSWTVLLVVITSIIFKYRKPT